MENFLLKLFDIKKIPTKLIFVIWISTGLILFVPEDSLSKLNLVEFLDGYGKYIGILFIISSSFLIIVFVSYLNQTFNKQKSRKQIRKSILSNISRLDFHEKALLREFFINQK